ncbi:MAG TPA: hypothetical protein PK176_14820 [Acidobacteriota bacterium]|nr:hypothetical protein [Acidobacteriota bacterium]HQM64581.1 hypothetical protein [Acidobacteriota bacterium]
MSNRQNIPVKFVYPEGRENIRFVNQFAFAQIDTDVVVDVGVVDPKLVLDMNQKIHSHTLQPDDHLEAVIIQRFGMSITSFIKLKQQIDQIFQNLEKQGVLVKRPDQDTLQ